MREIKYYKNQDNVPFVEEIDFELINGRKMFASGAVSSRQLAISKLMEKYRVKSNAQKFDYTSGKLVDEPSEIQIPFENEYYDYYPLPLDKGVVEIEFKEYNELAEEYYLTLNKQNAKESTKKG